MASKIADKILFSVAVLLLCGAVAWLVLQKGPSLTPSVTSELKSYTAEAAKAPAVTDTTWPTAPDQSKDLGILKPEGWVYDVFTNPRIYYYDGAFHVDKPKTVVVEEIPFGVEFSAVKPDPFRLQLVGFVGQNGIFVSMKDGDTIVAHAGQRIDDLNLEIRDFVIKDMPLAGQDPETQINVATGVATVVDIKTGESYTLNTQTQLLSGSPFGVLRATANKQDLEPMKKGSKFTLNVAGVDASFTIDEVTENPPAIKVTKVASNLTTPGNTEQQTLEPAEPAPNEKTSK